jgi:hypothetical protein
MGLRSSTGELTASIKSPPAPVVGARFDTVKTEMYEFHSGYEITGTFSPSPHNTEPDLMYRSSGRPEVVGGDEAVTSEAGSRGH